MFLISDHSLAQSEQAFYLYFDSAYIERDPDYEELRTRFVDSFEEEQPSFDSFDDEKPNPNRKVKIISTSEKITIWVTRVKHEVRWNQPDYGVELSASATGPQDPAPMLLCYARFALIAGSGRYAYGFRSVPPGPCPYDNANTVSIGFWVSNAGGGWQNQKSSWMEIEITTIGVTSDAYKIHQEFCMQKQRQLFPISNWEQFPKLGRKDPATYYSGQRRTRIIWDNGEENLATSPYWSER